MSDTFLQNYDLFLFLQNDSSDFFFSGMLISNISFCTSLTSNPNLMHFMAAIIAVVRLLSLNSLINRNS